MEVVEGVFVDPLLTLILELELEKFYSRAIAICKENINCLRLMLVNISNGEATWPDTCNWQRDW